jgi:hypothetical protein
VKYKNISTLAIWSLMDELSNKKDLLIGNALGDEPSKNNLVGDIFKLGMQYTMEFIMEKLSEMDDSVDEGDQ